MIVVVLWIMVVFIMGRVQVLVGRVALIVNDVMTNTEYLEDLSAGNNICKNLTRVVDIFLA